MEKVTIQLEEATVKVLDRFMELKGSSLTREENVNVIVLSNLGANLCGVDDEFAESELSEEMRATIKRLDPVTDKKARFRMVAREIGTLLFLYKIIEDENAKNEIKQDVIDLINDLEAKTEEKREIIKAMRDFVINMEVSDEEEEKVKQDMLSFIGSIELTTEEIYNEE